MKFLVSIAFIIVMISTHAQVRLQSTFGSPTFQEINMETFPADPDAAGVVLFEQGVYKVEVISGYVRLVKEVYRKIKVLDAKNFKQGDIEILFYKGDDSAEQVTAIEAVTHNGEVKKYVSDNAIFTSDLSTNWKAKKFTLPDVTNGSILEYKYRIESPYFFNLEGWNFQGELPVLYSEFYTEIPGNYRYNKAMFGTNPLYINKADIKRNCFYLEGVNEGADCETGLYAMKNIPAFKEEDFMLSKNNYISRIKYELSEYRNFSGDVQRYSKSWEDVDKELRFDKDLGRQLKNGKYFKKQLPATILAMDPDKNKAIAVYNHIRDHFTWDKRYRAFTDIEVTEAYDRKVGNSGEINLSLINALEVAGFNAYVVLGATRQNGLPSSDFPVISDFNYTFVALKINDETILLDATRKDAPFSLLPFEILNERGRLMDFKEGSYWVPINAFKRNLHTVSAQVSVIDNNLFEGKVKETFDGYLAHNERAKIRNKTQQGYFQELGSYNDQSELSALKINNLDNPKDKLSLNYNVELRPEIIGDKLYLNPFFFKTLFKENPFKLKMRSYPVDFGYPLKAVYLISIDLKDVLSAKVLPKNKSIQLPKDQGTMQFTCVQNGNSVQMRYSFSLNESRFAPESYAGLQQFMDAVIENQLKNPLILNTTK